MRRAEEAGLPSRPERDCVKNPLTVDPLVALRSRCWSASRIVDVFDRAGRYLGEIPLPAEIVPRQLQVKIFADGNSVIAATEDATRTLKVKKYRIETPHVFD